MKPILLLNNQHDVYYNGAKCMSYNMFWNELVGGRGVGKTTWALMYVMNKYIRNDEQFIYLRRYKNEIKEFVNKHTLESLYDGILIKGSGTGESYEVINEKDTCGFLMTLAGQSKFKSSIFDRVTTIVFDEVFLEKGRTYYLPNEVTHFLQLVSTVQRTRSNLKLILLSNNNSTFNPYHTYWSIPDFKSIWINKKRGIYCEKIPINPKLLEKEKLTPLYKLTAGTAYGNYHYDNQVLRTVEIVEEPTKPNGAYYYLTLIANREPITFYKIPNLPNDELWVANESVPNKELYTYELFKDDRIVPYYAKTFRGKFLGYFNKLMAHNRIHFQSAKCYDILIFILEVIK